MKKQRKRKKIRFKSTTFRRSSQPHIKDIKPEDLVLHIRRAEKEVIPLIKEMNMSAGAAQFLLAQYTYVFATGSNQFLEEEAMMIANGVLALWKSGLYVPGPKYPFTLEETLQEIEGGLKAKKDYADAFQAFLPAKGDQPRGMGHVAGGLVKHPETQLWQIWMIIDGPCTYLGAYRNPEDAQRDLQEIIDTSRGGGIDAETQALYKRVQSHGDGQPKQISFDMMTYLVDHLHLYQIQL